MSELCGDISPRGAMCVLYSTHLCQCASQEGERWWPLVRRPGGWPDYIGRQIAEWFIERGLVPCVVDDSYNPTVGVIRIHGSRPGQPQLKRLCARAAQRRTLALRPATFADLCSWLPCRGCTNEVAKLIVSNHWPPKGPCP